MNRAEFKVGQSVSFRAYLYQPVSGLLAKVTGIMRGMNGSGKHLDGSPDNRIFYQISGSSVYSITSGLSLIESMHYEEPT